MREAFWLAANMHCFALWILFQKSPSILLNPCPTSASKSLKGIQNFRTMKKLLFFLALFLPFTFGFSMPEVENLTTCSDPANVSVVSKTSSSISFDWDDCGCGQTEYRVYYVQGEYVSPESSTTSSSFTYTGLSAGTYSFYFYTVCGAEVSGFVVLEDTLEL